MTAIKKLIITTLLAATPLMAQVKEKIEVPYMAFPIKMGKGFDAVQANCLMCHSFGYIINQGRQSRAFWKGKIDKMIIHFKAPISDKDTKTIEDYLFQHYGNGKEQ
ncbi:sulfite:cytochrome C oxidoreductase subunit B [Sulfurovum sp. NBC37-1]|uniref:sulfite:cytochrome C oxidoreductase subunit B n=1 Tax=Sulfurovum sp. (strain NBC37-1) TaxID=387093 RepID=UPI000158743F|nr:sulfite:cytochrome C oxidoreductase subunit B [Sulfurovum sp. NBC37-1]BAF72058.1 sulfite:cytochrome c oxidoreductase subunit B [Sulfurovum sp. NBC37-1]